MMNKILSIFGTLPFLCACIVLIGINIVILSIDIIGGKDINLDDIMTIIYGLVLLFISIKQRKRIRYE